MTYCMLVLHVACRGRSAPPPLHELITALNMFLLARYKLDLAGVLEVRWDKGGTVARGVYTVLVGNSEG
jgi:hypothetical protein